MEEEKGLGAEVPEEDRRAPGEAMMLGNGGKKALGEEWREFKFVAANGKRKDGDISVAGAEAFKEHGSNLLDDSKMRLVPHPRL